MQSDFALMNEEPDYMMSGRMYQDRYVAFNTEFNNEKFYYIHSYVGYPNDKNNIIATANYGDNEFCAMVSKNNIIGTQFHPEKSSYIGLEFLKGVIKIIE